MMKNGDYFIIIICESTLGCCVIQYLDFCKLDDLDITTDTKCCKIKYGISVQILKLRGFAGLMYCNN